MPPSITPFASPYRLDQIATAQPGWRVVFWDGLGHTTEPVYMLALATNTTTTDPGLIVSLIYTPLAGWQCAETLPTYCGLCPPGWDLGRYERDDPHGHVPVMAP